MTEDDRISCYKENKTDESPSETFICGGMMTEEEVLEYFKSGKYLMEVYDRI